MSRKSYEATLSVFLGSGRSLTFTVNGKRDPKVPADWQKLADWHLNETTPVYDLRHSLGFSTLSRAAIEALDVQVKEVAPE